MVKALLITSSFISPPFTETTLRNDHPMGRPPCCDKSNVKRGPWTPDEDAKILAYVASHGIGNWTLVPLKAGLNRCGKSCRLRWTNYLRPDLKHDNFTAQEEECILELHKTIGSRWSLIAKRLPGRTDNDVKNYWNTKLKKKLTKMGIDPITHKPFSQLLTEYGQISGISNSNHFLHNFTQKIEKPAYDLSSTNHQTDTMAQFGAIKQENVLTRFFKEYSDSFPSSAVTLFGSIPSDLCEPSQVQNVPFSPLAINDYVFREQMLEANMGMLSLNDDYFQVQEEGFKCHFAEDGIGEFTEVASKCSPDDAAAATSSGADSFVDAILDHGS